MRLLSLFFFASVSSLLSFCNGLGQDSTQRRVIQNPTRVVLKWAPLTLLDADGGLQLGSEVRTGSRTAVQAELGYGGQGALRWESGSRFDDKRVFRARAEVRLYTGRFRTNRKRGIAERSASLLGNYSAFELFFKNISLTERWGYVNREFTRESPLTKQVLGLHAKIGRQFGLTDRANQHRARVLMDVYVGAGVRYSWVDGMTAAKDPAYEEPLSMFNRFHPGRYFTPSLALGLKLGFGL